MTVDVSKAVALSKGSSPKAYDRLFEPLTPIFKKVAPFLSTNDKRAHFEPFCSPIDKSTQPLTIPSSKASPHEHTINAAAVSSLSLV